MCSLLQICVQYCIDVAYVVEIKLNSFIHSQTVMIMIIIFFVHCATMISTIQWINVKTARHTSLNNDQYASKCDVGLHFTVKKQSFIYTIICLKSVCLATFAQCSSQFWLNRVGRCVKLIASTRGTFCHEFAPQFGLDFFIRQKNRKPLSPAYFDPRCGDKQRNWKRQNRGNSVV